VTTVCPLPIAAVAACGPIAGDAIATVPDLPRRVVLACNPRAGHFREDRVASLRAALAAQDFAVTVIDSLVYVADPARHQADAVGVVGGDGTARLVADAIAGTVNLIARETGTADATPAALAAALRDPACRALHRVARIAADGPEEASGEATFLCCASIGPDSAVVSAVTDAAKRRWGRMAYVLAMAALLWRWPRHRLAVTVDGTTCKAEAAFVLKGRFYAGPWQLDPDAALDSAALQLVLLPRARRRDVARLALSALLGPFATRLGCADPTWIRLAAHDIHIASEQPLPVQADGDAVATTPVRFSLATAPMRFVSLAARHRDRGAAHDLFRETECP